MFIIIKSIFKQYLIIWDKSKAYTLLYVFWVKRKRKPLAVCDPISNMSRFQPRTAICFCRLLKNSRQLSKNHSRLHQHTYVLLHNIGKIVRLWHFIVSSSTDRDRRVQTIVRSRARNFRSFPFYLLIAIMGMGCGSWK